MSSAATNFITVELLVLSFCSFYFLMVGPFPCDWFSPMCPLQLGFTPWDPSTHHLKMLVLYVCVVNGSLDILRRCLIMHTIFFQSSSSGSITRVIISSTTILMFPLDLLLENIYLAKKLWHIFDFSYLINIALPQFFNKWSDSCFADILYCRCYWWIISPCI